MTPQQSLTPQVWVMDPEVDPSGNAQFPWDWAAWHVDNRLIPVTSIEAVGSTGSATFRLLRRNLLQNGAAEFTDQTSTFRVGCYVCIATGTETTGPADAPIELPDIAEIKWFGVCTSTSFETADVYDYVGTVSATEVGGAILENLRVEGFRQVGTGGYPSRLDTAPPLNLRDGSASILVGNAILGTDASSHPAYIFSRELADLGSDTVADAAKYWTPWRALCHLVQFCVPAGLPPMWASVEGLTTDPDAYTFPGKAGEGLLGWIDSPEKATNYNFDGLTFTGCLDLLFSTGTGTGWRITPAKSGSTYYWKVTVFSRSAHASLYGPPKNKDYTRSYIVDESKTVSINYEEDDESVYDEVIVQGAPILFGVSVSPLDGNLGQAWNDAQEVAYEAATGTERAQSKFDAVFSSFLLKRQVADAGITRSTSGGKATGSAPLTPLVSWDGSVAKIEPNNQDQYLPALRLSTVVPFFEGVNWDGTKTANVATEKTPKYIGPQVYYYDSAASTVKWKDLLTRVSTETVSPFSESPQVDVPDNRPGIKIRYSRPHTLGLGTFVSTDTGGQAAEFDWRKLVCTVGVESDQRLEVRRVRVFNNASATQIRRQLIVKDDAFRFHCTLAGTVVGLKSDNTDSRVTSSDVITVNDYPAAQAYCDELSEWALRKTLSARIVTTNDLSMSVYQPGQSLRQVVDNGVGRAIDGLIAAIETDWGSQRITIQTELPPRPSGASGSPSPARGGAVSSELGGSVPQVAQRTQIAQSKTGADVAARPLIPMMGGGGVASEPPVYLIIGGNALPSGLTLGILKRTDTILGSEMPAGTGGTSGDVIAMSASPIPAGLPVGVGVGVNIFTGVNAFLILDSTAIFGGNVSMGRKAYGLGTTVLDKVVVGVTYRYTCIPIQEAG